MNIKNTLARVTAISTMALAAVSAQAGTLADAVTKGTEGLIADLGGVGGTVISIVVATIGVGAVIRLLHKLG